MATRSTSGSSFLRSVSSAITATCKQRRLATGHTGSGAKPPVCLSQTGQIVRHFVLHLTFSLLPTKTPASPAFFCAARTPLLPPPPHDNQHPAWTCHALLPSNLTRPLSSLPCSPALPTGLVMFGALREDLLICKVDSVAVEVVRLEEARPELGLTQVVWNVLCVLRLHCKDAK